MKVKEKNLELKDLIIKLHNMGFEKKAPIWSTIAKGLNRPQRKNYKVNVFKIGKYTKPKEIIVVPGIILGSGDIKKPVTVAALKFSASAKEKIEKVGGMCLSINELIEKNPRGSDMRIMG